MGDFADMEISCGEARYDGPHGLDADGLAERFGSPRRSYYPRTKRPAPMAWCDQVGMKKLTDDPVKFHLSCCKINVIFGD